MSQPELAPKTADNVRSHLGVEMLYFLEVVAAILIIIFILWLIFGRR